MKSGSVLIKHKEDCLSISGQQSINLEKGTIKFKNYFKQLPVPFTIYAAFEWYFENAERYLHKKNIMSMFPVVMLIKFFVLMINSVSQLLFTKV